MKRFAVFGHPVAHSLSPRIHAAFAAQCGIALEYTAIDATPEDFETTVAAFARAGGRGANVTLPHKAAAAALCTRLTARAQAAGAVNTLLRTDDGWDGDNTDGIGLVRDLTGRQRMDLRGRRTLLLGAGGAARGVAPALLDAGIGALVVANRTAANAEALIAAIAGDAPTAACALVALPAQGAFDVIVNATSAARGEGMPALPASLVHAQTVAVDLGYGASAAPFLHWAQQAGIGACIDGLGMLVEQAAESFRLWHGTHPATDPVYRELYTDRRGAARA